MTAYFSQNGIHGNLKVEESDGKITLETYFKEFKNISENSWSWSIHEFPVHYENINGDVRCSISQLGKKLYDLDNVFGGLVLDHNETAVRQFDSSVLDGGKY